MGLELEFYCSNDLDTNNFKKIIKEERGKFQYEIDFGPSKNIVSIIEEVEQAKSAIENYAISQNLVVNFSAKPHKNDYGSAMHIHLNFEEDIQLDKYANMLCHFARETVNYFIPIKSDFARLDHKFMAPTHYCYGGNNRTCMIRIPDTVPRRLEHRLASASVDPVLPIYAILASILASFEGCRNINQGKKIYGNAFDPQFNLVRIRS